MTRRRMTVMDFDAVHRGLEAAGLDRDYFGFDDLLHLFRCGYTVERIVQTAVQDAERRRATAPGR